MLHQLDQLLRLNQQVQLDREQLMLLRLVQLLHLHLRNQYYLLVRLHHLFLTRQLDRLDRVNPPRNPENPTHHHYSNLLQGHLFHYRLSPSN